MSAEEVRGGRRIRVIDLETSGPSVHNVCEIGWQDVVLGDDGLWTVNGERGAVFVNPGAPISTDTMAVHHIVDADVVGARFWRDAAPPILQPAGGAVALAAHRATFEQRFCTPRLSGGARWICTRKCAMRTWPDLAGFSNQRLRYQRMPVGLDRAIGLPAHRALPDAYVTAHHLRDMLNASSLEQLLAWSEQPGLLPRVPAGPHRKRPWSELSDKTLSVFVQDRDVDVRYRATDEMRRRGTSGGGGGCPKPGAAVAALINLHIGALRTASMNAPAYGTYRRPAANRRSRPSRHGLSRWHTGLPTFFITPLGRGLGGYPQRTRRVV